MVKVEADFDNVTVFKDTPLPPPPPIPHLIQTEQVQKVEILTLKTCQDKKGDETKGKMWSSSTLKFIGHWDLRELSTE